MPLETGDFIPELDPNNPLGADNVSIGDDHMRLIKRAVTGSFPAFVGTTATPKSVTLTEDQINDAALKSVFQTITADWRFGIGVTVASSQWYASRNNANSAQLNLMRSNIADEIEIGNGVNLVSALGTWGFAGAATFNDTTTHNAELRVQQNALRMSNNIPINSLDVGAGARHMLSIDATDVMNVGSAAIPSTAFGPWRHADRLEADGSVEISAAGLGMQLGGIDTTITAADSAYVGFGNLSPFPNIAAGDLVFIPRTSIEGKAHMLCGSPDPTPVQVWGSSLIEMQVPVTFTGNLTMDNGIAFQSLDAGAVARNLMRVSAANNFTIGEPTILELFLEAFTTSTFRIGGVDVVKIVERLDGSLLVRDQLGIEKKAGFRNPTRNPISVNTSLVQDNEGQILEVAGAGVTLTADALEEFTTMRVLSASLTYTIVEGAAVTLRWYDGSGSAQTGTRTVLGGSAVELYWLTGTLVAIFGNGIS